MRSAHSAAASVWSKRRRTARSNASRPPARASATHASAESAAHAPSAASGTVGVARASSRAPTILNGAEHARHAPPPAGSRAEGDRHATYTPVASVGGTRQRRAPSSARQSRAMCAAARSAAAPA